MLVIVLPIILAVIAVVSSKPIANRFGLLVGVLYLTLCGMAIGILIKALTV